MESTLVIDLKKQEPKIHAGEGSTCVTVVQGHYRRDQLIQGTEVSTRSLSRGMTCSILSEAS